MCAINGAQRGRLFTVYTQIDFDRLIVYYYVVIMTEKLERIRATRRGNRGVITRFINEAKQHLQTEENIKTSKDRLNTLHDLLEEKLMVVKQFDQEILELCEIKDIENEIEESEEINSRVLDVKKEISKAVSEAVVHEQQHVQQRSTKPKIVNESVEDGQPPPVQDLTEEVSNQHQAQETAVSGISSLNSVTVQGVQNIENNNNNNGNANFNNGTYASTTAFQNESLPPYSAKSKLPKLILPKFKGDITSFRPFWNSFENAVHNNPSLSRIDKFNYLYSLLEGPALLAIKGLALTEENYQASVDILKQRFGNTQLVISAHMDELLKLPVSSGDKPSQLRIIYDKISVNVRGLEALGIKSDQYGSLLIPVIMSKLPSEIRIEIARKTTSEVWQIHDLLEIIRKEIEAREISENVRVNEFGVKDGNDNRKQNDSWKQNRQRFSSASSLFVKEGNTGETKMKCVYCGEFHFSSSCGRVKNISARKEILKQNKRCYLCLRIGHRASECDKSRKCRRCDGKHHQSICNRELISTSPKLNSKLTEESLKQESNDHGNSLTENQNSTTTTTATCTRNPSKVLLQTATTFAYSHHSTTTIPVRVLLDSGSQRSYVTNHLKKRLGILPDKTEMLNLNTFGEDQFTQRQCDVVNLNLQVTQGEDIEISAVCFQKICSPISTKIHLDQHPHLKGLNLADSSLIENDHDIIDILIGADYYYDIVMGEIVRGESGPVAVNSKLGWILSGPSNEADSDNSISMSHLVIERNAPTLLDSSHVLNQDDNIINNLRRFWDTESIGITEQPTVKPTEFLQDVRFNGDEGRYEVGLPWKKDCSPQSTGYLSCVKRLWQLHSRLKKDHVLMEEYNNIIKQQIDSGIIEAVPDEDDTNEGSYYLPHHGVVRKDKQTTKLRVVFDGSAKPNVNSPSINECLEKGPNLVPRLFDTIIKFRGYPIGIVSDIEKAFHQVQINPVDRSMLRFLWFDDVGKANPKIKRFQFRRLVFGLTPSPAVLATVIQHHLSLHKDEEPETVSILSDSLYVDDLAGGVHNDQEALEIYNKSRKLMEKGGFMLRKWNSNSKALRKQIVADEMSNENQAVQEVQAMSKQDTCITKETPVEENDKNKHESKSVQILGLHWNVESDNFQFNLTELVDYATSLPPTKRSVLKVSAKIFDPIGLLSPFTINLKNLFQILCSDRVDWDAMLDEKSLSIWNSLVNDLEAVASVTVPRCYYAHSEMAIKSQQIHGFCDASEKAYAAVVYLRTEYEDRHVHTNIISAKTRVAPLKKQSIPRLELLGANILARLVSLSVRFCGRC